MAPPNSPATKTPKKRRFRWLKRLALVLLIIGVLGVAGFTWIAYWPLEGSVERVEDLVPSDAEFLLQTTWSELKATRFVDRNVVDRPLVPDLKDVVDDELKPALEQLRSVEAQINDSIPLGLVTFGFEQDVFPREIIAAGKICRGQTPDRGGPAWREILLLTRVTWKTKAGLAAFLKHGFVRDMVGGPVRFSETDDTDVHRLEFPGIPVRSVQARSGCGAGIVMPPENVWYVLRVKDVLALSNSESLIHGVAELSREGVGQEPFSSRPGFDLDAPEGSIAAAVDLEPLHAYAIRALELGGDKLKILKRFLTVDSLDRMNGHLDVSNEDLLAGHAEIRQHVDRLLSGVRENYARPPLDLMSGLPNLVPAEDTFAVLFLRSDPLYLLDAIHQDALSPADRELWRNNVAREGLYATVEEFLKDCSRHLGDSAAIAVARLGSTFDAVEYPGFYSGEPDPMEVLAFLLPLRQGAVQAEVDEFLQKRVHLMGFKKDLERVTYRGITYSKMALEQETADFRFVQPAFLLHQDHLLLATNEEYFKKIIDTIVDPQGHPPLAADDSFRSAMGNVSRKGHVGLFVDVEKLTRVPPDLSPGKGPRGFLWDSRNLWVLQNRGSREESIRFRTEVEGRYPSRRTAQQEKEIETQVEAHVKAHEARFPEFLEERRKMLEGLRRFRALGVSVLAQGSTLTVDVAVSLREGP